MQRKNGRQHGSTKQRQKLSRRTIIIIVASCMTCLVIGLTIFFNVSHVDKTMAKPVKEFMMQDQEYTNEMTLAAPVIVERPVVNETTQMMRAAKAIKGEEKLSTK